MLCIPIREERNPERRQLHSGMKIVTAYQSNSGDYQMIVASIFWTGLIAGVVHVYAGVDPISALMPPSCCR